MSQFVECGLFHVQALHSLDGCNFTGLPLVNHLGVIIGERSFRSAEFHALVKCQPDSLGLAYADFAAFLFGGVGEQLKDDAANQILFKVGFLCSVSACRLSQCPRPCAECRATRP